MARILVAEDDAGLRLTVSRALAMDGHTVDIAEDGEEALEYLDAADGGYDLLLSDIRMPAMDGIQLAHIAARHWPAVTVLLMTGYAEQRERADDLAAIIEDVLDKPFTVAELRRAAGRALLAPASAPEPERRYA